MGFFPVLVGDVEVRQRRPRYPGEPKYKRCSFVRPKATEETESWEIIEPSRSHRQTYQNIWDHPQWNLLSHEQQRAYLEEHYRRAGMQPRLFQQPQLIQPQIIQPQLIQPRPIIHQAPQRREPEPRYEVIAPRKQKKEKKVVKIDRGHAIFESDSDTDSWSSKTTYGGYTSNKSSRSGSSSSSGTTIRPVRGW